MLKNDKPHVLWNPVRIIGDEYLKLGDDVYDSIDDLMKIRVNGNGLPP